MKKNIYIKLDVLFVVFGIVYMIGDTDHYDITAFRCAKPLPVWIMIIELYTVMGLQKNIKQLMLALLFGSIGDILLEFQSINFVFFAIGALSFLVGHLFYVLAFVNITVDIAEGHSTLKEILKYKPLFVVLWLTFFSFSFWSIGKIIQFIDDGSIMMVIIPIYGTFLCMLVMGGLFFFFMTFNQKPALKAALCFMIGSIVFYASDSVLAHGKFDLSYKANVSTFTNATLIMVTYYVAQFLMGKGGLKVG